MPLDLTPTEIIMLARVVNLTPDMAVTWLPDGKTMGLFTEHPDFKSLVEKVEKALGEPDVKKALDIVEGH